MILYNLLSSSQIVISLVSTPIIACGEMDVIITLKLSFPSRAILSSTISNGEQTLVSEGRNSCICFTAMKSSESNINNKRIMLIHYMHA